MPYIKPEDRLRLEANPADIRTAGELNYSVYKYAKSKITNYQSLNDIISDIEKTIEYYQNWALFRDNRNKVYSIIRYSSLSNEDIVGALRCCELEIYRRLAGPYEDKCIERNGDVE